MKNLSSGWIFVKKSKANFFFRFIARQQFTSLRPLLEEILFGLPGKTKNIEIHVIRGWISQWRSTLRMDFPALKDVFYRKIRIPDLKIKIRIRQSQALRFLWKRRLHSDWSRLTLDPVSSKPHSKWRTSCREFRTERIDVALNCRFISTVVLCLM